MPWLGCPNNALTGMHIPTKDDPLRCGRCGARRKPESPRKARRNSDPEASHLAADAIVSSGRAGSLRATAMRYVQLYPGKTAGELGELSGLGHDKLWRRISELKRDGYVFYGELRTWRGTPQHTVWPK